MGRIDLVRGDMMAAMKAKDKERKNVLSGLLTELKNFQINNMKELSEEDADHVVLKLIKQSKETLSMTPADRKDIIDECNYTIKVLEEYAPKMMDEDEIREVINSVLAELSIETPSAKDKGNIMKTLMPKIKGKADGSLVNKVLKSMME